MVGEADSYYHPNNSNQGNVPPPQYDGQHGYGQPYGQQYGQPYEQPQPVYNGYQAPPPPEQQQPYARPPNGYGGADEKQSFDQTFKIEKPKWNDVWAGILVGSPTPSTT